MRYGAVLTPYHGQIDAIIRTGECGRVSEQFDTTDKVIHCL